MSPFYPYTPFNVQPSFVVRAALILEVLCLAELLSPIARAFVVVNELDSILIIVDPNCPLKTMVIYDLWGPVILVVL